MKGILDARVLCGWNTAVYIPGRIKALLPVLFLFGEENIKEEILELAALAEKRDQLLSSPFLLAGIGAADWENAYSPWEASELAPGGKPFLGKADETAAFLVKEYAPYIGDRYPARPGRNSRAVAGYSLGGLGALYTFLQTGAFAGAASCSGSLWYPGWREYMEKSSFAGAVFEKPSYVYLSLGRRERKTRSRIMAKNPENTAAAKELLSEKLSEDSHVMLEWNNGGHSFEVKERLLKAMFWLTPFLQDKKHKIIL